MNKKILLIHSNDIPQIYLSKLKAVLPAEVEMFPLSTSSNVYDTIGSHPDIFILQIDKKTLIVSEKLETPLLEKLSEYKINVIKAGSFPTGKYPDSSILNVVKVGDNLIHNTQYTDNVVLSFAQDHNLSVINVKQGYARCSTVPVTSKAIITSNKGIANKSNIIGIDVLLIQPEHVLLNGQKYGLIGGASGTFVNGTTVFLGDITKHPDFSKIDAFFKKLKQSYLYLEGLPLFDAGSLIFVEQ